MPASFKPWPAEKAQAASKAREGDSAAGRELVEAEAGPAAWMNGEHVRDVSGEKDGSQLCRASLGFEMESKLRSGEKIPRIKLRNGE